MNSERIGISTTTFANFNLSEGPRVVGERLQGYVYAPEIVAASSVIHALGLTGNEIVYRKGMEKLDLSNVYVQMHGPVFYDLPHAINEGREASIKSAGINAMIALFAMGTVKDDLNRARKISEGLGISNIVLHPYGADLAFKNSLISIDNTAGAVGITIEPDYKRPKDNDFIIYDPYKIVDIAQETGFKVCMDTSHTVITTNDLSSLQEYYDIYNRAGVMGNTVHFSIAIPSPDGYFFTTDRGAEPLYRNTPDKIANPYREFVERVLSDGRTVIIEISSFPDEDSSRLEAVKQTLDMLFAPSTPATYSIPK